jgi:hypothetical protein
MEVWVKLGPFIHSYNGRKKTVCCKCAFVRPFQKLTKKSKPNSLLQAVTQLRSAISKTHKRGTTQPNITCHTGQLLPPFLVDTVWEQNSSDCHYQTHTSISNFVGCEHPWDHKHYSKGVCYYTFFTQTK